MSVHKCTIPVNPNAIIIDAKAKNWVQQVKIIELMKINKLTFTPGTRKLGRKSTHFNLDLSNDKTTSTCSLFENKTLRTKFHSDLTLPT